MLGHFSEAICIWKPPLHIDYSAEMRAHSTWECENNFDKHESKCMV